MRVISLALAAATLAAGLLTTPAQAAFTSPGGVIGSGWVNVPAQSSITVLGDPSAAQVVAPGTTLSWQVKDIIALPAELAVDASPIAQNPTACQMYVIAQPQKLRRDPNGTWWLNAGTGATLRGYTSSTSTTPAMTWDSTSGVAAQFRSYQQARLDVTFAEPGTYAVMVYLSSDFCPPTTPGNTSSGNVVSSDGRQIIAKYLVEVKSAVDWQRPETGWYWDPSQGGRGFAIQINDAQTAGFLGVFGYDTAGRPTFLVSTCRYSAATRACTGNLDGFQGGVTLTELTGPSATTTGTVSTVTMQWDPVDTGGVGKGNRTGTISYAGMTRRLERFVTPGSGETAAAPRDISKGAGIQTGWYWNPNAAGRGYFIETTRLADGSGKIAVFSVGFMYRADRTATWYVMQGTSAQRSAPYTLDSQPVAEFTGGSAITVSEPWQTASLTGVAGLFNLSLPGGTAPTMYLASQTGQGLVPFTISPP